MFDQHVQKHEELKHRQHAEIRAARLHGDGTIEEGEQELERIRAAKYRRERDAARAELAELRRQLAEVRS